MMGHRDPKVATLSGITLFADIPRRLLARLARQLDTVDVAAGTTLVQQGAFAREFIVVAEGTADVTRDGVHIGDVGPGEVLGELAFFGNRLRTATAVARTPMRVFVGSPRAFSALLALPLVAERIRTTVASRAPRLPVTN